jgi:putative spermidine/putrescine transport system permease protein
MFLSVFLVAPIVMVFRSSFYRAAGVTGSGFSLEHYSKFFSDSYYLSVLVDTLGFGVVTALLSVVVGFPVGYSLARLPPERRRWRLLLVVIPLSLSLVVILFGWLVILGRGGLLNTVLVWLSLVDRPQRLLFSHGALLVVLLQEFLPFMILSVMSVVSQIDPVLEHASASLRADRFTTFRKVILPLAAPGILSGATLVFILTVSSFITPEIIGGDKIQMLGGVIYAQVLTVFDWPFAASISFVLLAITLLVVAATNASFKPLLNPEGKREG